MKLKLKEKVATAEAVQFDGSRESAFEVAEFVGRWSTIQIDSSTGGPVLTIKFKELSWPELTDEARVLKLRRSDYAVVFPGDKVGVMPKAEFNAKWQVDEESDTPERRGESMKAAMDRLDRNIKAGRLRPTDGLRWPTFPYDPASDMLDSLARYGFRQ